mmetsp:Transcript_21014/g.54728  ORF Transcript_21014/g.54728 Transcript_21014/m.54728 type:complete len:501 (+) Transcript_21014:147-1649(+)
MVRGYTSPGQYDDPDTIPLLHGERLQQQRKLPASVKAHLEADAPGNSGVVAGFVQMLQGNLGPGILTLPFVFTQGGVAVTSCMLVLVLLLTLYSMSLVLRAKKFVHSQPKWVDVEESKRPQSFQGIGRELLGPRGEKVIIVFVAMMQLGICMVFFNFAATELIAVEEYYMLDRNESSDVLAHPDNTTHTPTLGKPEIILCATPLALALSLGRSPTVIVVAASMATLIMYTTIGTILFLVFWHVYAYFPGWKELQVAPLKPAYLPIAFGNLVYTVTTSIGILLPIENSLGPRAKTQYQGIVTAAMTVTLLLDMMVGLLSNVAFGPQTHESITAEFIEEEIGRPDWIIGINCALALSVLLTYPLQFRPACEVVEAAVGVGALPDEDDNGGLLLQDGEVDRTWWQKWGYIPVRTVLVLFTAALAAGIPQLDLMVSLAGSFTACVLALMIPPAMDIATMYASGSFPKGRVAMDTLVVLVGILGLVGGTGATLLQIAGVDVEKLL